MLKRTLFPIYCQVFYLFKIWWLGWLQLFHQDQKSISNPFTFYIWKRIGSNYQRSQRKFLRKGAQEFYLWHMNCKKWYYRIMRKLIFQRKFRRKTTILEFFAASRESQMINFFLPVTILGSGHWIPLCQYFFFSY